MLITTLLKGLLVGFGASIPLGPIGVLVVQRTLSKGRMSGFVSGMGAAVVDTFFSALAILSLALVVALFETNRNLFLILGGLIVVAIGVKIYLTNPIKEIRKKKNGNRLFGDFISVLMLTISNPGAIFLILGLFALVGLHLNPDDGKELIVIALAGVFAGATLWWFMLSTFIGKYRYRFRIRQLRILNRVSGFVITVLGIISLAKGLYDWISHLCA
jgi:threonine/homoserine/homoserine lactone efflux protein